MKLKWKISLLFFLLTLALFILMIFYLRVDVIERIWGKVNFQRGVYEKEEKEIADQVAELYPDKDSMIAYLKKSSKKEQLSLKLYDRDAYTVLGSASSQVEGKSSDVRWYPVRKEGKTLAFIYVKRPITEKDIGLEKALTNTFLLLLAFLFLLFILLAIYFNYSMTKPLSFLNRRFDKLNLQRPLVPLTSDRCDEIGDLYRRFGEMEERLHRSHREQVEMVAAITHDLKTPLTSIKGFLELLETHAREEDRQEYIHLVRHKAEAMTGMLEVFSAYTQNEAMLQEVKLELVPIREFFESIASEYEAELSGLGYRMEWKHDFHEQHQVCLHESMIRRVFANLISNAVRYGEREDLLIQLQGRVEQNEVRIILEDNGRGVPMEDLPFLFQRFFTVDQSRQSESGGTGLGLASCRSIIERHGGQIRAYQGENGGLGISFSLPLFWSD